MPQFDAQSAKRIAKTVRYTERRLRNVSWHRARYTDNRPTLVMFELLENLAQWAPLTAPVMAARKTWDPTVNGGDGGYTVDCADIIYVADFNRVGHTANKGGFGAAEMHARVNEPQWVGVIIDLCCPGEEQGACP